MRIDIAASKNDHLIAWKKTAIDKNQNIDSVKNIAKSNLETNRQNFRNDSKLAFWEIWMLFIGYSTISSILQAKTCG